MDENTYIDKKLNIGIYTDDDKEFETYNKILKNIKKILPNIQFNELKNISIIILLKQLNDNELIKYCYNNNIIIFSNKKKSSNIYFNDTNTLIDYIQLIKKNTIVFTIIIPYVNDINIFLLTLKTILDQPINNYKILVCICKTTYTNNINKITKLKILNNIILHIVDDNSSKYLNINSIIKTIDSEYFMIIDSGTKFIKNKLLYDFININILNNNNYYIIQNKCIIYENNIKNENFSTKNMIFKTKIIKKIGYFCNNRFYSDEEYLMRTKYFIGDEYIYLDKKITLSYNADLNNDSNNDLIYIENNKKFLTIVDNIIKIIPNTKLYFNKYFDYFSHLNIIDLNKLNKLNFIQYKTFYYDLNILNDYELSKHWINIGKEEGRLYNENIFYKSYPNFNCLDYMKNNKYNIRFENIQYVMGWIYLKNKSQYLKWLKNNNYIKQYNLTNEINISNLSNVSNVSNVSNLTFNSNELIKLDEYINKNNIKYIQVSEHIIYLKKRLIDKFNLIEYNKLTDKFENTLFVGLFDKNDYLLLTEHIGIKYLMWEGFDIYEKNKINNNIIEKIVKYNNITHLSISKNIYKSLQNLEINPVNIYLNIVNENIFRPIYNYNQCIFIYNGEFMNNEINNKINNEINEKIYGKPIYDRIIELFPEYEYIFSNQLNISYQELSSIYSKCFIGLKLTNFDCIDYTVQEMNYMNIPIISNSNGGIKWIDINDIIRYIKTHIKLLKINNKYLTHNNINSGDNETNTDNAANTDNETNTDITNSKNIEIINRMTYYDEVIECNFFEKDIEFKNLKKIYQNIDNFISLFKDIKKILFICGDYPGYGGAATNCNDIRTFFKNKNYQTFSIYFNYQMDNNKKYYISSDMMIIEQSKLYIELQKLNFEPEIIILKSNIDINLKKIFNCPIFFLIPGIFNNNLDRNYLELKSNEYEEYINQNVLFNIKNYDVSFTNSSHTKNILLNNYGLKTYLFYSGFIRYHNNYNIITDDFNTRKYTFGIIASDLTRKIKNIEYSISILSNFVESNEVIIIGKNNEKFKKYNFTFIENIEHENILDYYKNIKYIVQDSFFESCSNVKIEAYMNGSKFVNSSYIKKLQILKPIEKNNILFIHYNKNDNENINEKINTLVKISNFFIDLNVYILVLTKNINNINFENNHSNIYIYEINDNLKYFIEKKFDKIYLFDYELPFILNKRFPEDKLIISLLSTNKYNLNKDINKELYNYYYQTINYDEISIDLCYKLVEPLCSYDNNKYMKYNHENNLMNTLIIFNLIT